MSRNFESFPQRRDSSVPKGDFYSFWGVCVTFPFVLRFKSGSRTRDTSPAPQTGAALSSPSMGVQ